MIFLLKFMIGAEQQNVFSRQEYCVQCIVYSIWGTLCVVFSV
jgi:hypothetical protein